MPNFFGILHLYIHKVDSVNGQTISFMLFLVGESGFYPKSHKQTRFSGTVQYIGERISRGYQTPVRAKG